MRQPRVPLGRAVVMGPGRASTADRDLSGGVVVEVRVGPSLVVGASVLLDQDRGLTYREEDLLVQALVAEATVKALAHTVLPRLAGVDVLTGATEQTRGATGCWVLSRPISSAVLRSFLELLRVVDDAPQRFLVRMLVHQRRREISATHRWTAPLFDISNP